MSVSETFKGMFAVSYDDGKISLAENTRNLLTGQDASETMTYGGGGNPISAGDMLTGTTTSPGGINAGFSYVGAVEQGDNYVGILVRDTSNQQYYVLTIKAGDGLSGDGWGENRLTVRDTLGWDLLGQTGAPAPACFMAGTAIRTPTGAVAVESLKAGDLVSLSDGRAVPVIWLGRQSVSMVFADPLRVLPIRVKAGALGANLPARDLRLSPCHALLVDDILVQAGALVNGASIVREEDVPATFVYYHVEVAEHALILAEDAPAETFVDNIDRLGFDNWAERAAMAAEGGITEMAYPRAKSIRQVPVAIRKRLGAIAAAMDAARDAAA